jgi:hypothetical protein
MEVNDNNMNITNMMHIANSPFEAVSIPIILETNTSISGNRQNIPTTIPATSHKRVYFRSRVPFLRNLANISKYAITIILENTCKLLLIINICTLLSNQCSILYTSLPSPSAKQVFCNIKTWYKAVVLFLITSHFIPGLKFLFNYTVLTP